MGRMLAKSTKRRIYRSEDRFEPSELKLALVPCENPQKYRYCKMHVLRMRVKAPRYLQWKKAILHEESLGYFPMY